MSAVAKPGVVRLRGEALRLLRRQCFARDGWRCVVCGVTVTWTTGEMAHVTARGAGGSDTIENVKTKCSGCHRREHNPRAIVKWRGKPWVEDEVDAALKQWRNKR